MEKIFIPRAIGAAVGLCIGSLVLIGCGGGSANGESTTSSSEPEATPSPSIEVEYYDNGMRIIRYEEEDGYYSDILQFCDGRDLVEQTSYHIRSGNASTRSVGHVACVDGVLKPDDFKVGARG